MQKLCTNDMAVAPGGIVYTGMLNQQGGYETYCTATRLSPTKLVHTFLPLLPIPSFLSLSFPLAPIPTFPCPNLLSSTTD